MQNKGQHATLDAYLATYPGCATIMALCVQAIAASGMRVVSKLHEQFEPQGVTAVWILAESHFTLHTYPEHNYISVDCYTCGNEGNPVSAIAALRARLGKHTGQVRSFSRGALPEGLNISHAGR